MSSTDLNRIASAISATVARNVQESLGFSPAQEEGKCVPQFTCPIKHTCGPGHKCDDEYDCKREYICAQKFIG